MQSKRGGDFPEEPKAKEAALKEYLDKSEVKEIERKGAKIAHSTAQYIYHILELNYGGIGSLAYIAKLKKDLETMTRDRIYTLSELENRIKLKLPAIEINPPQQDSKREKAICYRIANFILQEIYGRPEYDYKLRNENWFQKLIGEFNISLPKEPERIEKELQKLALEYSR